MTKNTNNVGNGRVLKWLPLTAIALAGAVVWGAQQTTTAEHERRITSNEKLLRHLTQGQAKLMQGQSRVDERTRLMHETIKENKTMLQKMLGYFRPDRREL